MKASYLSSPQCGCDFVVATTQASINSGLREYLAEQDHPIQYLCIMLDDKGNPTVQISLDELKAKANGANPFEIPETGRTPDQDKQLDDLADADFAVGLKWQMGLPPGVSPKDLDIVTLGSSADRVTFRMFCSQMTAVQLKATRRRVVWNIFSQPAGAPWSVETTVDLVVADLDKELDSSTYLKTHPDVRQALRDALLNLSGTAFSLQQLMFDLDNAILETVPTFHGVEKGSDAEYILQKYFVDLYSATAKERGLPLVSINVVSQPQEESSVHMTAMDRIVCPLKDSSGHPIASPSPEQAAATTLNYLCVTNNKPVPRISGFDWNWVEPGKVNDISGVMAINRDVLMQTIVDTIRPAAKQFCLRPVISRNDGLQVCADDGTLTVKYPKGPKGIEDIRMEHWVEEDGMMSFAESDKETYARVEIDYYCDVTLDEENSKIKVNQGFSFEAGCKFPESDQGSGTDPKQWRTTVHVSLVSGAVRDLRSLRRPERGIAADQVV